MKQFAVLITVLVGLSVPSGAQEIDEVAVTQCDLLAANPSDPKRKAPGVDFENLDTSAALAACTDAQLTHPNVTRFKYMLGRVFDAMGNLDQAITLYEDAASLEYEYAAFILGVSYYEMAEAGKNTRQSFDLAVEWLKKAAHLGIEDANYNLAHMYSQFEQVSQNYKEAVRLLQPFVLKGDPDAQNLLGILYQEGKGVKQSDSEAAHWYELAAQSGLDHGQHNFALMLFNETGVKRDFDKAFFWFKEAARQGNEDSIVFLNRKFEDVMIMGVWVGPGNEFPEDFYEQTYGCTKDELVAWHLERADIGDAYAHYILGVIYWQGFVFEANKELGMRYLVKAVELGSDIAKFEISRVTKTTEPE